jgi:threonine synthase
MYDTALTSVSAESGLWSFAPWLPVHEPANRLSIGEGGTPLLGAHGNYGCQVWLKDEGRNPTGSHKDRALAVALSVAREVGIGTIVLASAGSTGLSAAAYAAAAGIRCVVLVTRSTPQARINPLLVYGATVLRHPGSIDDAFQILAEVSDAAVAMDVSTIRHVNPFQAEAPRTIAFEIAAQLGDAPDWMIVPTGGGGTLAGIARGFHELERAGLTSRVPALVAVQPAAYNTLERGLARSDERFTDARELRVETDDPTILSKLVHAFPPDGLRALAALKTTHGTAVSVSDADALGNQLVLGQIEGLFVEPSAAAGLAGLRQLVGRGLIGPRDRVVVCLTGSGWRVQDELEATLLGAVVHGPDDLSAQWIVDLLTSEGSM